MSFVRMDGFFYCGIILSIFYLLQPVTAFRIDDPLCRREKVGKEAKLGNFWVNSSSESSIHFTTRFKPSWNQADYFFLQYQTCRYEMWPRLVHYPPLHVYEVRYDFEDSFYFLKRMDLPESHLMPSTQMQVNVTNLPFPGWPYAFHLYGDINGIGYIFAEVLGRTDPAIPKVCAGCFLTLWTRRQEQKRKVRVYWPRREGQQISFLLSVHERSSDHTTMLVYEYERTNPEMFDDNGYVDVVIGMRSYVLQFIETRLEATELPTPSIIVVPDEQNVLEWVPGIHTTIDKKTILKIHTLSWEKPKNVDVVEYYTLVWYDKKKWREDPYLSPMMDWIYIPGNLTSINFKIMGSEENDVKRVGWRLIANTETSSSGLQDFDDTDQKLVSKLH